MPLYEYDCKNCKHKFEKVKFKAVSSSHDAGEPCPICNIISERIQISETSAPVFKGDGFYATDYKGKHT
jgi:putative FmdB family regulatory protein